MFAEINLTEEAQIFSSVKLDFKIFKNYQIPSLYDFSV